MGKNHWKQFSISAGSMLNCSENYDSYKKKKKNPFHWVFNKERQINMNKIMKKSDMILVFCFSFEFKFLIISLTTFSLIKWF